MNNTLTKQVLEYRIYVKNKFDNATTMIIILSLVFYNNRK